MANLKKQSTLVLTAFVALFLTNCERKPVKMVFYNIKGFDYVSSPQVDKVKEKLTKGNKALTDVLDILENGITKKPGVLFEASLGRKLGAASVLIQVVNLKNGSVADKESLDANPDMTGLSLPYNFQKKGEYLVNFIVKDEIIAQGKIKYE